MKVPRNLLITISLLALSVGTARAQEDERTSIRIEAEIISGLDTGAFPAETTTASELPGQATAGQATVQTTGQTTGQTTTGQVTPGETTEVDGETDQPGEQIGGQQGGQIQASQSVDDVARTLLTSAQDGSLSVSDTAMVAALNAGRRSNRQNVDGLVTITVIDESGNVRTSSMRNTDLNPDLLGPSVRMLGQQVQQMPLSQNELTGDLMRRSSGITYFYVQVCSCGL